MTRYKLTIEYDGTHFCGWQRQQEHPSVQQTIEEAIQKFCGETVTLHVAGRTDAGVHARANVAHVDIAKETDANTVRDAINFHVKPHRVVIRETEAVSDEFHARFNAVARSYKYRVLNRRPPPALDIDHAWHIAKPLDVDAMQRAADLLIGHHDFSTFRAKDCQSNSPLKTMERFEISRDDENIVFFTRARSFLYHQVRNMVGTLGLVGSGQWTLDDFKTAFAAHDRTKGGPTAPPQGLVFWEVSY